MQVRRTARTFHSRWPRLAELAEQFDVFLLDVWGVLIDGEQCLPGVPQALSWLVATGRAVVLVTNSSRRSCEVQQMLVAMGLDCAADLPVLSSGDLAYEAVVRDWVPGRHRVWVLGKQPGSDWIHTVGCRMASGPGDAQAILVWGLVQADFEDRLGLLLADAAVRRLPMVCANPDRSVQIGACSHASAGALAAFYERLGGAVSWFGKPDPEVFRRAIALAGYADVERTVVIGDSLDTDMAGARAAGCAPVLVAPGDVEAENVAAHAVLRCFAC